MKNLIDILDLSTAEIDEMIAEDTLIKMKHTAYGHIANVPTESLVNWQKKTESPVNMVKLK